MNLDVPRLIQAADLRSVIDLDTKTFGRTWTVRQYLDELADGLRCKVTGPIGNVTSAMWYRWRGNVVELETLAVARGHRNRGLGSALLRRLLALRADTYGWVHEDNPRALDLYKRHGFVVLRREARRYPRGVAGIRIGWKP